MNPNEEFEKWWEQFLGKQWVTKETAKEIYLAGWTGGARQILAQKSTESVAR